MKTNKILLSLTLAVTALVGSVASAQADTLAFYDFETTPRNSASGPPTTMATGVIASGVTRGSGLLTDATVTTGYLNANGFEGTPAVTATSTPAMPGTKDQAINGNDFFTFNFRPTDPTTTLTLTQLDLQVARSGTGPTDFFVRSSIDNFVTDLFSISGAPSTAAAGTIATPTFKNGTVMFGSQFQNISNPIEFRVFGFGAVNSGTTQGGVGRIDNILLQGTVNSAVAAVPEPSTYALFAVGMLGFGIALRRKKLAGDAADASTSASVLSPC